MKSVTIPAEIARAIYYKNMHPIKAWRIYYKLDQAAFAKYLGYSIEYIEKIETSNLHLKTDICKHISSSLGVDPIAIQLRHIPL